MFTRSILDHLRQWSLKKDRKPLILRGARQVGKTTAVNLFAREFNQYLYFDLEKREEADIFKRGLSIEELIQALYFSKKVSPAGGNTLIFLDEIQSCPEAVSMLRYFYESAPHLHVIAAGSLLETMMGKNQISFPVGRVTYLFMAPLTFKEFLVSVDESQAGKILANIPLSRYAIPELLRLFHQYTLVGGMPEVVDNWRDSKDIVGLTPLYQGLLTSYMDDVSKYARNSTMVQVIRHAIESAPLEAGKRIRFHGFGSSNYRSREMSEALKTLERAMLLYLLYPTTNTKPPLLVDRRKSPRLQFLDTGLINYFAGLQDYYFHGKDLHGLYHGIIIEHIVGQELMALHPEHPNKVSFWVREKKQSTAEVDFLVPYKQILIPVEVKAGKAGTLRSLHQYMDRVNHPFAVRLYSGNLEQVRSSTPLGKRFMLLNLPYFLAGQINEYLEWMIEETR